MTDRVATDLEILDSLYRLGFLDPKAVMAYQGGTDLDKPGLGPRRRTRLDLVDVWGTKHVLFLKRYVGAPSLAERARLWWEHGHVSSPAEVEASNIKAAAGAGVPTMSEMGCRSGAWGSYLITTAVPGEALERLGEPFWRRVTEDERAGADLAARLAELVRSLHRSGYVHRDLYASHVFLDEQDGRIGLYLIDLARMFRPRWRRFRWRVKDLASLHYSLPQEWVSRWWPAVLRSYLGDASAARLERWRLAIERKSSRIAAHAKTHGASEAGAGNPSPRSGRHEDSPGRSGAEAGDTGSMSHRAREAGD